MMQSPRPLRQVRQKGLQANPGEAHVKAKDLAILVSMRK